MTLIKKGSYIMKIAIDAMGGDNAPKSVVEGALKARDEFSDLELILYGNETEVKKYITDMTRITIVNTTEVIDMNDEPVKAIRRKKDSSLVVAANTVKAKEADALFSCGNTGALLTAGLLLIGRIKGINRPGLLSTLPVVSGQNGAFDLLDSGANAESKPEHLYQYALLGEYYAKNVRGIENPRICLLNNGAEEHKGNEVTQKAHQLLAADEKINFIGNIEAKELMQGKCDVVVADGFTGNAVLKAIEGTASAVMSLLKDSIADAGLKGKLGALLLKDDLKSIKTRMDPAQYGGAVLLGVKAPVVKAHGSSDALTVYYTLRQIHTMLKEDMVPKFTTYWQAKQALDTQK